MTSPAGSNDLDSWRSRELIVPLLAALPVGAILGALVGAGIWIDVTAQGLGEGGVVSLMVTFAIVGSIVALVAAVGSVLAVLTARHRGTGRTARIAVGAGASVGSAVLLTSLFGASSSWWATAAWVAGVATVASAVVAASVTLLSQRLLQRRSRRRSPQSP